MTTLVLLVHMMKYSDIFIRCQCYFVCGNTSENITHELLMSKLYTVTLTVYVHVAINPLHKLSYFSDKNTGCSGNAKYILE